MEKVIYKIDRYAIELYAVDRKGKRQRWGGRVIRLFSGNQEVAQAVFSAQAKDIPEPYISGGKIYYFAPAHQYQAVVDLLRNEKSVYVAWQPVADPKEPQDGDAYFCTSPD